MFYNWRHSCKLEIQYEQLIPELCFISLTSWNYRIFSHVALTLQKILFWILQNGVFLKDPSNLASHWTNKKNHYLFQLGTCNCGNSEYFQLVNFDSLLYHRILFLCSFIFSPLCITWIWASNMYTVSCSWFLVIFYYPFYSESQRWLKVLVQFLVCIAPSQPPALKPWNPSTLVHISRINPSL